MMMVFFLRESAWQLGSFVGGAWVEGCRMRMSSSVGDCVYACLTGSFPAFCLHGIPGHFLSLLGPGYVKGAGQVPWKPQLWWGVFPLAGLHTVRYPPATLPQLGAAFGLFPALCKFRGTPRNRSWPESWPSLGSGAVSRSPDRQPLLHLYSARNRRKQDGPSNTKGHRRSGVLAAPRPRRHRQQFRQA
ncbi:uncharacterized protein LY79DRAFT_12707 [Colletotrichum navitas]|uniref:Uncharacterized protein n=1 Tax=Colletotrichum navitas TaxID=681940 RepID=A0AAD8QFC7_9PEZI|nr:uncharacterized protein LY79DRAFT_12707 [Colletotrichum navitas]KAK1600268.1 hypothetical protein LY79DRAFT_12707 [Colletotrichum navitas]